MAIAVRIPKNKALIKLLEQTGPLLTTSANLPGDKPAGTIADAQKIFGSKIDTYIDGGDLSDRKPSTVIRIVDDAVEIIRQGAVLIDVSGRLIS
jgi:L-threonylcarbamoyladenylate synthase